MKNTKTLLVTTVLAGSLWALNASAQFAAGDLMLGVRSSAGVTNLVFDLGSASSLKASTTPTDLSSYSSIITSAFGSLNNLYFSVFGYVDAANASSLGYAGNTVFLSKVRSSAYVTGTDPYVGISPSLSLSSSAQGTVVGYLSAIATGAAGSTVIATGIAGVDPSLNVAGDISYVNGIKNPANANVSGNVHGTWGRYPVEGTTGSSFSSAVSLDIYQQNPGSANLGVYVGTLTMDSLGSLSFVPSAVPEPSTFAMVGAGFLALGAVRRFNRKN